MNEEIVKDEISINENYFNELLLNKDIIDKMNQILSKLFDFIIFPPFLV